MPLSDDDVREILRLIDESNVEELRIETEAFSLHVLRGAAGARLPEPGPAPGLAAAPTPSQAPTSEEALDSAADGMLTIEAPMLGTFYRAPAPGETPFVDVGTPVDPDTVVCIIEVMKMMNPIPAGVSGTVAEICVENATPVEYGQPIFRVRPA
jgi:acetyl-CoA carboxylase biotin carboxyl carrier protein